MSSEDPVAVLLGAEVVTKGRNMTSWGVFISIGVSLLVAIAEILAFSFLRKRHRYIYEPRTFVVPSHMRMPPTNEGMFSWIPATYRAPLSSIPEKVGLDAYFFLRYIIFVVVVCLVLGFTTIPILLPLHITGNASGDYTHPHSGLDKLTISNVSWLNRNRHIAHLVLCALCAILLLVAFQRELGNFHRIRAEYMLQDPSPQSSSALLLKGLHPNFRSPEAVFRFYSGIQSGCVKQIWFNRDFSVLEKLIAKQNHARDELERQESWLVGRCAISTQETDCKDAAIAGNLWRKYLNDDDMSGMHSRKGSYIVWLKSELSRINAHLFLMQSQTELFPQLNSCFVQFDSPISCFMAMRSIGVSSEPRSGLFVRRPHTSPGTQCIGRVYPSDIVWTNLRLSTWLERFIGYIATFLDLAVILGWAFPMTLVSMITQVEFMAKIIPQFQFLVQYPEISHVMGSVVSPLLLTYLTSQVPFLFRVFAKMKGYPTQTLIEMDVQKYLFLFMFFQIFLIVAVSSGLLGLIVRVLLNTSEGAMSLASSLPKASTFFLTYLVASSLTTSGNSFLQSWRLVTMSWQAYTAKTPRDHLRVVQSQPTIYWGSLFPIVTNIATIAISYALISPLILFAGAIGAGLLFFALKYRILFCYVPRCVADGNFYPCAIFQLFSGLYCQQLSLLGTLMISRQDILALVTALIMIGTALAHYRLTKSFHDDDGRIPLGVQLKSDVPKDPESLKSYGGGSIRDRWRHILDEVAQEQAVVVEQRAYTQDHLFEHPAVRSARPSVWIARDSRGIAQDQVHEMQTYFSDLRASCAGAELDESTLEVTITQLPPDFDSALLSKH